MENAIEWYTGNKKCLLTITQMRYKNRIYKLKKKYPDEVEILKMPEENDGYLLVRVPVSWIRINAPAVNRRTYTEEEKQALRYRLAQMRETRRRNLAQGLAADAQEAEVIEELEEELDEAE